MNVMLKCVVFKYCDLGIFDFIGVILMGVDFCYCDINNILGKDIFYFCVGKYCGYYVDGEIRIGGDVGFIYFWLESYGDIL